MGKRLGTTLCHSRLRRMTVPLLAIIVVYLVCSFHFQFQHTTILNKKATAFQGTLPKNIVEYPQDKYNIVPNIDLKEGNHDVDGDTEITLCTQTSLSNLFRITTTAETWDGKISIAVFAFDKSVLEAQQYIKLLRMCSKNVTEKVSFHLVFPVDRPPKPLNISEQDNNCKRLSVLKGKFHGENYASKQVPYPVNVLRNVALMYANTPYVINMDIDFLPSKNAKPEIEAFLSGLNDKEKEKKLLYVLPSFEAKISRTDMLKSKTELLKALKADLVRRFTLKKCGLCHKPTNFTRWLALPYPSEMDVAYFARFNYSYEPIYVAQKKSLPMFDGRFKQYGFNRYSQICEAYFSGFDFAVMNNAFVVHDGFKSLNEYNHNKGKQKDYGHNKKLFLQVFLRDLVLKYPKSKRTCLLQ